MFINWIYLQHTRNSVCRAAASASLEEAQQEQHGDNLNLTFYKKKYFILVGLGLLLSLILKAAKVLGPVQFSKINTRPTYETTKTKIWFNFVSR